MIRTILFCLFFQFILFPSFAQKLKAQELMHYSWSCLNSHWSDQQLLDQDTLILVKAYDLETDEWVCDPADYDYGLFEFYFEDSARSVDVFGIKKIFTFPLMVHDSVLYHELKSEQTLTSAALKSLVPELTDTVSYVSVNHGGQELVFQRKAESWKRVALKKSAVLRYIVDLTAVKGASWQLDEKRRILTLQNVNGDQTIHYRIRRVSKNKFLLIRIP